MVYFLPSDRKNHILDNPILFGVIAFPRNIKSRQPRAKMTQLPILYSFRRCPYAIRARMALAASAVTVELREVKLQSKPTELLEASPKGTVPILLLPDGLVIDESLDIMIWALERNHNQTWLNKDNKEMSLINLNDTEFKKYLDRYKYHDRHPQNSKESYRNKCNTILEEYEKSLIKSQYLINDNVNIADISIFPFVRQFANVDYTWFENNYVYLSRWLKNISSSEIFTSVMKKYDTWDKNKESKIINFR